MKKIELHHIAKRLPYGLRFFDPNIEEFSTLIRGCVEENVYSTIADDNYEIYTSDGYDFKPILFPLSALTQEITVKGETFVPIVELTKIVGIYQGNFKITEKEIVFTNIGSRNKTYFRYDAISESFVLGIDHINDYRNYTVKNQKLLFEKLLEFNIDTDNLIEQGLAISVFELNENPYA